MTVVTDGGGGGDNGGDGDGGGDGSGGSSGGSGGGGGGSGGGDGGDSGGGSGGSGGGDGGDSGGGCKALTITCARRRSMPAGCITVPDWSTLREMLSHWSTICQHLGRRNR